MHEVKNRYRSAQVKAAVKINAEQLLFNWELGRDLVERKAEETWGSGIVEQVSLDLQNEFPEARGFSTRNLWNMKKWYLSYTSGGEREKLHQLGAELKSINGITSNLVGMFDSTNQHIGEIAGNVGTTPQAWNGSVFSMIQNLSETVIVPIAGLILAFVMTLELIQLITEKNNLHDLDTWMFFKWTFKSAAAILIVTNTWNIVMGVFDVAQSVVNSASGVIVGDTTLPQQSADIL